MTDKNGENKQMSNVQNLGSPVVRTSAGLRDALFDELDGLRNGSTNPARANAVAKLAGQVIDCVKMELDVQRHMQKMPKQEAKIAAPPTVALSSA
jgi:hypothetical protein